MVKDVKNSHNQSPIPQWLLGQMSRVSHWQALDYYQVKRVDYKEWFNFVSAKDLSLEQVSENRFKAIDDDTISGKNFIHHLENSTVTRSLDPQAEAEGVILCDLFEAAEAYPDIVRPALFSLISPEMDAVAAYNVSHLNGGIFVYIPDNVVVESPIEIFWQQENHQAQAFNKRLLIIGGENSKFTIVERLRSQGDQENSATIMTEIILHPQAQLNYISFDTMGSSSSPYIRRYCRTENDASIQWSIAALNDGNTVLDIQTDLLGQGSQANIATIAVGDSHQQQAIDVKITNYGWGTIGNIIQHGAVLEQARISFNGIGHIIKQAKHADSQQESRLLMLSDQARGDANPILLIDEFEVQAGHAASVGRVNEDQLYYLMSRGLTRKEAEYLVIRGFLGEVFNEVKDQALREEIIAALDHKLRNY